MVGSCSPGSWISSLARRICYVAVGLFVGISSAGCEKAPAAKGTKNPRVIVTRPITDTVLDYQDFTGRLASLSDKDPDEPSDSRKRSDTPKLQAWFEVDEGSYLRFQRLVAEVSLDRVGLIRTQALDAA